MLENCHHTSFIVVSNYSRHGFQKTDIQVLDTILPYQGGSKRKYFITGLSINFVQSFNTRDVQSQQFLESESYRNRFPEFQNRIGIA